MTEDPSGTALLGVFEVSSLHYCLRYKTGLMIFPECLILHLQPAHNSLKICLLAAAEGLLMVNPSGHINYRPDGAMVDSSTAQ